MNKVVTVSVPPAYQEPEYDYIGRLHRAIRRNTTKEFEFEVRRENRYRAWWNKILLFPPKERIVFMDLDTVIVGNIDFLFEYDGDFAILRDFYYPHHYGSAIMSIAPGFGKEIIEDFYDGITQKHFKGDQEWIRASVLNADRWQDLYPNKIVSYKMHCVKDRLPAEAAIVCMHGIPKQTDLMHLPWITEHWR